MTNEELFIQQKELLDTFLNTGAITKEQYEKSLKGLIDKMQIDINKIKDITKEKNK